MVNQVKTQVWNRCGERPPDCDHSFSELTAHPLTCGVVTQHHPPTKRASLFLALLSVARVEAQLVEKTEEHGILLDSFPKVSISSVVVL